MTTIAIKSETLDNFNRGKAKYAAKIGKIPATDEFIIYLLELQEKHQR